MVNIMDRLEEEFPREAIHWRAQAFTKDGSKAMVLPYIDARDVMDRLDDVCGGGGWQTSHYDVGGKTACKIGIKINEEWIWKSDGAGDTAVEGDKGAFSDSLKRSAVSWGIGRYLYKITPPWVPCNAKEKNGRWQLDLRTPFKVSPWDIVAGKEGAVKKGNYPLGITKLKELLAEAMDKFRHAESIDGLSDVISEYSQELNFSKVDCPAIHSEALLAYNNRKRELQQFERAE